MFSPQFQPLRPEVSAAAEEDEGGHPSDYSAPAESLLPPLPLPLTGVTL